MGKHGPACQCDAEKITFPHTINRFCLQVRLISVTDGTPHKGESGNWTDLFEADTYYDTLNHRDKIAALTSGKREPEDIREALGFLVDGLLQKSLKKDGLAEDYRIVSRTSVYNEVITHDGDKVTTLRSREDTDVPCDPADLSTGQQPTQEPLRSSGTVH